MVASYRSIEPVDKQFLNTEVCLDSSLVGISISNMQVIVLSSLPAEFTRVNEHEPHISEGAYVAIPIKSSTDCYGALFMESNNNPNFINTIETEILEAICNYTGEMLEKIKLMQLFNNYVATEIRTNILTEKAFKNRVHEEYLKAIDTKQNLIIVFIALDKYDTFVDAEKKTKIFQSIIDNIKQNTKKYELIGRVNPDIIGLLLYNRETNQVKLTIERIRQKLATKYINYKDEKISATISVGIAELKHNDTFEVFTANATTALRHAQKKSNYIEIYE